MVGKDKRNNGRNEAQGSLCEDVGKICWGNGVVQRGRKDPQARAEGRGKDSEDNSAGEKCAVFADPEERIIDKQHEQRQEPGQDDEHEVGQEVAQAGIIPKLVGQQRDGQYLGDNRHPPSEHAAPHETKAHHQLDDEWHDIGYQGADALGTGEIDCGSATGRS